MPVNKRVAEQRCLITDIEINDSKLNLLEIKAREMIENLKKLCCEFDAYQITVQAYEKGYFDGQ